MVYVDDEGIKERFKINKFANDISMLRFPLEDVYDGPQNERPIPTWWFPMF